MLKTFLIGLSLVFVLEGLLPFLVPHIWRRAMTQMVVQNDKSLRTFGLVSMLIGLALLYLTH